MSKILYVNKKIGKFCGTIVVPGSARLFNPSNPSVTIDKSFAASQVFGVSGSVVTATA